MNNVKCPYSDGTRLFDCTGCSNKPLKQDISTLIKIYIVERLTWLNFREDSTLMYGEYWKNIMFNHVQVISQFTTFEELDNDLRNNLRMSFDEWYDSL